MTDTYLHSLYPNMSSQIDEAVANGYGTQEIMDHIGVMINTARQEGYSDDELGKYLGAPVQKKVGHNPFLATTYAFLGATQRSMVEFTRGQLKTPDDIAKTAGIPNSEIANRIADEAIANYTANAEFWEELAKKEGAGWIDKLVGGFFGGGAIGMADFALDVVRKPLEAGVAGIGAVAGTRSQDEFKQATIEAVKVLTLKKLLHYFNMLKQPYAAGATGGTFAAETAAAGGTPEEVGASFATGVGFSVGGKGTIGVKEIRDPKSGQAKYESFIKRAGEQQAEEIAAEGEQSRREIEKVMKPPIVAEPSGEEEPRFELGGTEPETRAKVVQSGLLPSVMVDGQLYVGSKTHAGAVPPEVLEGAKDVRVGWVDKDGTFVDSSEAAEYIMEKEAAAKAKPSEAAKAKVEAPVEGIIKKLGDLGVKGVTPEIEEALRSFPIHIKDIRLMTEGELRTNPDSNALWDKASGVVSVRKGVNISTVFHELAHGLRDMVTKEDRLAILKAMPEAKRGEPEEVFSAAAAEYFTNKKAFAKRPPVVQDVVKKYVGGEPIELTEEAESYPQFIEKETGQPSPVAPGLTIRKLRRYNRDPSRVKYEISDEDGRVKGEIEVSRNNWAPGEEVPDDALPNDVALIHNFNIKPRSRKRGIGTQALVKLEEKLASEGVIKVRLVPNTESPWLEKWYERMGYKGTGEIQEVGMGYEGGEVMEKKLIPAPKKEGTVGAQKARTDIKLMGKILDLQKEHAGETKGPLPNKHIREVLDVLDPNWTKVATLSRDPQEVMDEAIDKALKMSQASFRAGEKEGALQHHREMMELKDIDEQFKRNFRDLKNESSEITARIKRLADLRGIDPEYGERIQDILENYDLHTRTTKTLRTREDTRDWIARMEAQGDTIYLPDEKLRLVRSTPLNDMSMQELRNLDDLIQSIAHQGMLKSQLLTAKGVRDYNKRKSGLLDSIRKNAYKYKEPTDIEGTFPSERRTEGVWARFKEKLGNLAGATKIEYLADRLDGFKGKMYEKYGQAYDLLFRPRVVAESTELRLLEDDVKALNKALEPIKDKFRSMITEKQDIAGRSITKMEAMAVYWNSLNEGNRKALMTGMGMTEKQVNDIVASLDPKEKAFADNVLALVQSKGPAIAGVLKRMTGEKMKFEKDYFPLWFDYELSNRAAEAQQEQDLMKQLYSKLAVDREFTVRRVGGVEAPYLSFDVVIKHLSRVNHFIANAEAVRDMQKLLFDNDIRHTLESNLGEGAYQDMTGWLKEWANPRPQYSGQLERAIGMLRHNATLATLGFRVSTAILQPTAYMQLVNRIGVKSSIVGLIDFYRHPRQNTQRIYDMSPFMKARTYSYDRDLREFLGKDEFWGKTSAFKEAAIGMISAMDMATTLPAWQSAYNVAMKDMKWDSARSIEYADRIVRTTQGSAMPKDMPDVLRGGQFKRMFTMFYTYFSSTYNESARDIRATRAGEGGIRDITGSFFYLFFVPAAIQSIMRRREEWEAGDLATELFGNVAGVFPYIGPVVNAAITGFDYQASPVFEFPKAIVKSINAKEWPTKIKHAITALGYATGLPSRQAIMTAQYLADVWEGKSYDPTNLIYKQKEKKGGKWE